MCVYTPCEVLHKNIVKKLTHYLKTLNMELAFISLAYTLFAHMQCESLNTIHLSKCSIAIIVNDSIKKV